MVLKTLLALGRLDSLNDLKQVKLGRHKMTHLLSLKLSNGTFSRKLSNILLAVLGGIIYMFSLLI